MVHPIFKVLVSKPELVMDHMAGYAALVREEASTVGGEFTRRAIAWALVLLCLIVFLVLAGVAAMLGAMHAGFHWALLVVPAIPLALAAAALATARKPLPSKAFNELRAQLDADAETLRALGARS